LSSDKPALVGNLLRALRSKRKGMQDLGVTGQLVTDTFVLHGNPEHLVPSASRATQSGGGN
jgi:hypothetical protein